jgi:EpsI family protein
LGQISNRKIITVVVIFLLASVFVYGKPESVRSIKKRSLNEALVDVDGWKAGPHLPFDKKVVDGLALDDYLNRMFVKGDESVALYIGYYLTSKKVGAAHDPLVCFPGQGWVISGRESGTIKIGESTDLAVSCSTMRVERGAENKQIILYWFQAYDATNSNTLSQKTTAIKQRFTGGGEDNAFVRLTCSTTDDKSESECIETMQEFTRAFYPVFLEYIRE